MKGKAPSKNFFHDGTKYIITGNEELAESHFHEIRAFLHNIKRTNVNNLSIITAAKEFDDGTVAELSLIHGIEIINIFAPSEAGGEDAEEVKTVEIEKIVPIMRSTDNQYWIACMSGTFEPPYYTFKNIYDIPIEAFDDNIEIDLNKQLISRGQEEYDGSLDDPELYFLAQTAVMPENYDYESSGGYESNTSVASSVSDITTCLDEPSPYYSGRTGGSCWPEYELYDYEINLYSFVGWVESTTTLSGSPFKTIITVDELPLDIPDSLETTTQPSYTTRAKIESLVNSFTGWYNEGIYWPLCDPTLYEEYIAQVPDGNLGMATADMNERTGSASGTYGPYTVSTNINSLFNSLDNGGDGVRIETNIPSNFAAVYHETNAITNSTSTKTGSSLCTTIDGSVSNTYSFSETYKDWLQVNEERILVNTPDADKYPIAYCGENMLKYYNTDSRASLTALACVNLYGDGMTMEYKYYYIGPNSDDEFELTTFFEENDEGDHLIANVSGIDDTVRFYGEIFLGLVKYEIEYK